MTELRSTSPDGRYLIQVHLWEARMSHWIESPEILDSRTGEVLLRFEDGNWSLDDAFWENGTVVRLNLRKYPGDHPSAFKVYVSLEACTAVFEERQLELSGLEPALEKAYQRGGRPNS
ncbi:MAG: hypothetical protein SFU83_22245 [Meiothermus sp.]|nr:hypothetical protein [Meiothermus sp.]